MLLKLIDMALDVSYITVHNLVKARNHLALRTPADRDEQVDRQALVNDMREFELDPEDWD